MILQQITDDQPYNNGDDNGYPVHIALLFQFGDTALIKCLLFLLQ